MGVKELLRRRNPNLGRYLRDRRTALGWTLNDVAKRASISESYISKLENDRIPLPPRNTLLPIMTALGVDEDEINHLLSRREIDFRDIQKAYPVITKILTLALGRMTIEELKESLDLIERRLQELNEDENIVAENVAKLLAGALKPSDLPDDGSRPLNHYWKKWDREIEEWKKNPQQPSAGGRESAPDYQPRKEK